MCRKTATKGTKGPTFPLSSTTTQGCIITQNLSEVQPTINLWLECNCIVLLIILFWVWLNQLWVWLWATLQNQNPGSSPGKQ